MSNQPQSGFSTTQITVQNYDQLQQQNTTDLQGLDQQVPQVAVGGRYDFDDGGLYVGGWFEGKANGYGICTGPNCLGEYSGSWSFGFEVSGIYKWPQGTTYQGQWQNGRRHGLGIEYRGSWVYKGEWTQGNKGRYGVRCSNFSPASYEGTWANGLQDGYGSETYADGGYFQGQWIKGFRHGFGVRQSSAYGSVLGMSNMKPNLFSGLHSMDKGGSTQSLDTDGRAISGFLKRDAHMVRGGFVLVSRPSSDPKSKQARRRNSVIEKSNAAKTGLFRGLLKKQKSTGDIDMANLHGTISRVSGQQPPSGLHSVSSSTDSISLTGHMRFGGSNAVLNKQLGQDFDGQSNASFIIDNEQVDPSVTETYMGEWKEDKRTGFGICERSDGLVYAGEWWRNQKHGYGITTFPDGTTEEGKYKNNVLVASSKKKIAFMIRPTKLKERIDSSVQAARTAQQTAMKKADIAISRTATSRDKAEQAVIAANQAQQDSKLAVLAAKQFGALVIDPATNTISPTDQAAALNNLNDTESIINRIKNQSNLISLNDGQLSVPEIPLRRRLSQHNDARKSFRSQSIKDVQNQEFNNLHKINEEKKKTDAFPGRQASLKGRAQLSNEQPNNPYQQSMGLNQDYMGNQPPPVFSTPSNSTYGYQTESPQSFSSQTSRTHNIVRQSSQTNSQFQNQHASSSMYQSQPHLVRPNSSASSVHPYTSQRPPLNVQTSFDLGKSMIDHMDHYQTLHNRYASTSKLNQKSGTATPNRNRPPFTSNENFVNASPTRHNQFANQNLNRNFSNQPQNLASSYFKTTPDSGLGSLEESSTHNYQQQQAQNLLNSQQQQQSNLMNPSSHLQQSQQQLHQPHQLQQQQMYNNQFQQQSNMMNQSGFNIQQGSTSLQQQMNPLQQQQFNQQIHSMQQPYGSQPNLMSNLNDPLQLSGLQQSGFYQMNPHMNPIQQQQFNPMMMNSPQTSQMNNPSLLQQQSMWNQPNLNQFGQHPIQFQQQNAFQPQSSPPLGQANQMRQLSPQMNEQFNNDPMHQQQTPTQNRQAPQQQFTQQQFDQMNTSKLNSQSIQNQERQLEQHYGKQTDESFSSEPKRSSWRTASLFRPGIQMGDSKNKNESLLKRKPSLQTNFNKDPKKPIMSREQVSVMSSAEREHRRKEAELAQKMSRNPYIYFTTPKFRGWLREQQLILIVLTINLIVVLICYYLFYTIETK